VVFFWPRPEEHSIPNSHPVPSPSSAVDAELSTMYKYHFPLEACDRSYDVPPNEADRVPISSDVDALSGSLTTISKTAAPCIDVELTVSKPSVVDKSEAASGIKLGTPIAIPPANIIAIIVRLVNLRPISFFMLLEFLSNFSI